MTPETNCKNCQFGKPAGYRQVICQKKNQFEPELSSCGYWKEKPETEIDIPKQDN